MRALRLITVSLVLALAGINALGAPPASSPAPVRDNTPAGQPTSFKASELAHQARAVAGRFATTLQAALLDKLKDGDDSKAVKFCHDAAPQIAEKLRQESGWSLGRTSLRVRNPNNAPDEWERSMLEQFAQRHSKGEPFAALRQDAIVATGQAPVYRYMKAIPTMPACIRCHGAHIDRGTDQTIRTLYPQDQARGFTLGQIRGALTLKKSLQ